MKIPSKKTPAAPPAAAIATTAPVKADQEPATTTDNPTPDQAAVAAAVAEWRELRDRINRLNDLPPEVLREVARTRIAWPVMAGLGHVQVNDQACMLNEIALGSGVPIREFKKEGERKGISLNDPMNDPARVFLQMAIDARACGMTGTEHLPELSKKTAVKWGSYCWGEFLKVYPKPETYHAWRQLGVHREGRFVARNTAPKEVRAAERKGIRYGIREAFMDSVKRLVR